jgi:hypothetical protein
MSIILLRGFSHSGKDFVGQILCNEFDYKRFAFADSLKKIVSKEFNCPLETLHSQEGKLQVCASDPLNRTYRQILIDEALRLRNIDAGVFVKHCSTEIKEAMPERIVITDWRYPNELIIIKEAFPSHRITTVHILREGQLQSPVNDISEYQLDDLNSDYKILNRMDESIYQEVFRLVEAIHL